MLSYESSEGQLKMTNSHHSKMVHMGQIPQDGNFGENVAYFFKK